MTCLAFIPVFYRCMTELKKCSHILTISTSLDDMTGVWNTQEHVIIGTNYFIFSHETKARNNMLLQLQNDTYNIELWMVGTVPNTLKHFIYRDYKMRSLAASLYSDLGGVFRILMDSGTLHFLTAGTVKTSILWGVTPCRVVEVAASITRLHCLPWTWRQQHSQKCWYNFFSLFDTSLLVYNQSK